MKYFLALTLSFSSLATLAATSGTLLLKGSVPAKLSIDVSSEAIASTLPLDVSQTDTKVAEVTEKSNSHSGYKVTIASSNQGKLKRSSGTDLFAYTLKYNGAVLNLASPVVNSHPIASSVRTTKPVTISYTGVPSEDMVAGDYSDTITFTIAAN